MSTSVRKLTRLEAEAAVGVHNARRLDLLKLKAGLLFHADASTAVATANASDLPTSIVLITALQVAYTAHIASACDATTGIGAHIVADATHVLTAPVPTDLTSCETAINEVKAQFNLHIAATANHASADSTNTVGTADATNLATTWALANAVKTKMNSHFAAAFAAQALVLVPS